MEGAAGGGGVVRCLRASHVRKSGGMPVVMGKHTLYASRLSYIQRKYQRKNYPRVKTK